jgi:hypothetical protein
VPPGAGVALRAGALAALTAMDARLKTTAHAAASLQLNFGLWLWRASTKRKKQEHDQCFEQLHTPSRRLLPY